ncbi:MAG: response regulator [Bacteroidota bacterium]
MKSNFKRNLVVGYSVSLFLLIVSSAASFISIRNLLTNLRKVDETNNTILKLENVLGVLRDAETGQRGYLLTRETRFLEPYNGAEDKLNIALKEIRVLTQNDKVQARATENLAKLTHTRIESLAARIEEKKKGLEPTVDVLMFGKLKMDQIRQLIGEMTGRERLLLIARTNTMNSFAAATPVLILLASLLSIIVTGVSFYRVSNDFNQRSRLQNELLQKDEETSKRLSFIQAIAEKVSAGDYKARVSDEGKDVLGNLAFSLNKMAESLDFSFTNLTDKEWLQTGIAVLNEKMIDEKELGKLTYNIIGYMASYTNSQVGAFYLVKNQESLVLSASLGLTDAENRREIRMGEGLAGQCALAGRQMVLNEVEEAAYTIDFSAGSIKPKNVVAIPVYYERLLKGVIELASTGTYNEVTYEFLKTASFNIGMAIHGAKDHQRLQELLAETQAQSEELQVQHTELENINAELEAQAEKLQVSEEELRMQQEELQQSNQELEERSRLLEEKNELILERNLDIQRKAEELELSTRYKSEFLANMSHELRTPLNSILLLSRLLSENHEQNLSTDQVEFARVIQSSGTGLLTLIDEILDLSKIESGKMELQYEQVNIAALKDELHGMFFPMAKEKGIGFEIEVAERFPSNIETDRLRVEQILRNLVSNALKFTKQGTITLDISKKGGAYSFAVTDTGIGIPKDKQQTIFEAFQQADGSTRRQYGGTGLGLSISRELAKLLGGEILLTSEPGKGSTFTLLLPLQPKETQPASPDAPAKQLTAGPSLNNYSTPEHDSNQYLSTRIPDAVPDDRDQISKDDKVILVIEDDAAFAASLLNFTRSKGYKCLVAVRGDEGISLARRYKPAGILLDVQLPVKSGWDVMDELKGDPETRPIPVHMMSSHEVKMKSLNSGAVDFISKPVAFEKLATIFEKIEAALTRHPKKVLIVEENTRHAEALCYYLEGYNINAEIQSSVSAGIKALSRDEVDCVVLDMGMPGKQAYDTLEEVKQTPGMENLPIIIFTGKNLSQAEEMKIRKYADSIVVKTANSYNRILDEVSLFLHLVEENKTTVKANRYRKLGNLDEVLKNKTVLIADDDVRNIFSLTRSLEKHGVQVLSAMDGKEAIQKLEGNGKIDLVLMDMMMPEMDGYESIAQIRKNNNFKKLPVIAVTAKAMTGDREKCINAGASDYITKPVDVDQLISLLRVWLYAK